MWNWGPYGMMGGWGWSPLGMIFPVVFFVILIAVIIWALRPASRWPAASSGLEALKERYARGEIGREEFLQKKADLLE